VSLHNTICFDLYRFLAGKFLEHESERLSITANCSNPKEQKMKTLLRSTIVWAAFSGAFLFFYGTVASAEESKAYINRELNFTMAYPKDWVQGPVYPGAVLSVVSPKQTTDLVV
jgi:hypothetical protein